LGVTTATPSAAGITSIQGSAKWRAKAGVAVAAQRRLVRRRHGLLEDVGVDLPALCVVEIGIAVKEPGKTVHFDLLTCGR
jgi:hypothetical protein